MILGHGAGLAKMAHRVRRPELTTCPATARRAGVCAQRARHDATWSDPAIMRAGEDAICSACSSITRGADVTGRLVELDPVLAATAASTPPGIEVVCADAAQASAARRGAGRPRARADLRQHQRRRHRQTVERCRSSRRGATVVWTRHAAGPTTDAIRRWFPTAGFDEVGFTAPTTSVLTTGSTGHPGSDAGRSAAQTERRSHDRRRRQPDGGRRAFRLATRRRRGARPTRGTASRSALRAVRARCACRARTGGRRRSPRSDRRAPPSTTGVRPPRPCARA